LLVTSVVLGGRILRRFLIPTQPLPKDDLPLFTMTMCDATVNRHAMSQFNPEMDLVMGDLRIETPAFGRTLDSYRTILGLAPSVSTSLLSVKYCKGNKSVSSCNVGDADTHDCEACAVISLSPMR
jgi:vacuolar protein sorting-associated protein 13A/C